MTKSKSHKYEISWNYDKIKKKCYSYYWIDWHFQMRRRHELTWSESWDYCFSSESNFYHNWRILQHWCYYHPILWTVRMNQTKSISDLFANPIRSIVILSNQLINTHGMIAEILSGEMIIRNISLRQNSISLLSTKTWHFHSKHTMTSALLVSCCQKKSES